MSFNNPFAVEADDGVQGLGYGGFEVSLGCFTGLPDPQMVANPSVRLWLKSLLKKDDTTKEKALVEFNKFIPTHAEELQDDVVLISWTQLYPKMSLALSKSVRLLAHQTQTLLIGTLQKRYSRYLKDTIPTLLSGIYDSDASVAAATLKYATAAFRDGQRVDNLWLLFQREILNFADQALNKETVDSLSDERYVPRDEAELRQLRLVNAAVAMVSHALQVGVKLGDRLDKNGPEFSQFYEYENLWHYLLVSSNTNSQRICKTVLQLINATIHLKPDIFTPKAWKLMSKRLLKSLTFVKKVDPSSTKSVAYSAMVVPLLSTLNNLAQKSPSFCDYDKNHKEKILEFLRIGSLNSDPAYYIKLTSFITSSIFDEDDFVSLEKILIQDFQTEVQKNSSLRAGAPFIVNSLATYLETLDHFDHLDRSGAVIDIIMDINSRIGVQLVDPLAKFVPQRTIIEKLQEWSTKDSGAVEILLSVALKTSSPLESVLDKSFDDLRDRAEVDEDGKTFASHHAFAIYDFIIKNNLKEYSTHVAQFLDELPTFITPLIIDSPIQILQDYSKSVFYNRDLFVEIFDSFIIKLDFIGFKKSILSKMDSFGHRDELLSSSEELQSTINEETSTCDFTNDELFKPHLITPTSAKSLYKLAKDQGKESKYLELFLQNNKQNDELCQCVFLETSLLDDLLWSQSIPSLHETLQPLLLINENLKDKYFASLKVNVYNRGVTQEQIGTISKLLSSEPSLSEALVSLLPTEEFEVCYGNLIDSRLSIGNSLETDIYILSTKENTFQFNSLIGPLRFIQLLSSLQVDWPLDFLEYICVMLEVSHDYEFLNDGTRESLSIDSQLESSLKASLMKTFESFTFTSLISQLMSKSYSGILSLSSVESFAYYQCRLWKFVLGQLFESDSILSTDLDLDNYCKTALRSKSKPELLLFCTIISTVSTLISDLKFERLHNLVGSELIGLRSSEVISTGLTKLTILIDFTVGDNMMIQPQRLNMILNEFIKWLDSDAAYEPEFILLRIQLLHVFQLWNGMSWEPSDSFKELSIRILQESSSFVALDEGENLLELKYWVLKLYLTLKKNESLEPDIKKEIEQEILESFVHDRVSNANQPILIYNEMLTRVLANIPSKKLFEHEDQFIDKYYSTKNLVLKRPLLNILKNLIEMKQDNAVVEFELSKEGDDLTGFMIPQRLLDNVIKSPQFVGNGSLDEDENLIEYLWLWMLILANFHSITLKMRTMYIQQLQNDHEELLTRFLDFIASIITDDDKEFLKHLDSDPDCFVEYSFVNNIGELSDEVKLLSVHIYYTLLTSIGSLSSNWFNNIKDRGFKAKVEQFTSKYISPILIKHKLSTFEAQIPKLSADHENLTIKINRITNEIKSTYLIDEQYLEIVFKIPASYPLANVEVTGPQRVGVKETQWRAWLLACQRIVSLQNGEISESLEFFLKNVSFHFKGFEECAVCYSILHQDNSLPSKLCQTCKNKFHAGCLYKWFKSSGSNTCPLCRSPFNFK